MDILTFIFAFIKILIMVAALSLFGTISVVTLITGVIMMKTAIDERAESSDNGYKNNRKYYISNFEKSLNELYTGVFELLMTLLVLILISLYMIKSLNLL